MHPSSPSPLEALAGVANACEPVPGLLTGGQPDARHLDALKAAGVSVVLDLRDPMERRPFDEPAHAERIGLIYINVPVTSATVNDQTLERILEVVRANSNKPLFCHCGSGSRVGGALLPFFMLDKGMEEDTAVELAMQVGLRGADLLQWGLDYVSRQGS